MIQRVQSVYLFLSITTLLSGFILPFAMYTSSQVEIIELSIYGFSSDTMNSMMKAPLYMVFCVAAITSLLTLGFFKNRKRQLTFSRINYAIHVLLIVELYTMALTAPNAIIGFEKVMYGPGIFLPIVSLCFVFLAVRGIKKDEKLIDSIDRLR